MAHAALRLNSTPAVPTGDTKMRNFLKAETFKSFAKDQSGQFVLAFAALSTTALLGAGLAINYGQMSLAHSNLVNAVDGAVTSTARDITTGVIDIKDAEKNIRAFLEVNADTAFLDANTVKIDKIEVDRTAKTVEVVASANINIAIPMLGASKHRRVSTLSKSLYSDKLIEVAMMLDVTGSMGGRKIDDLKRAAKTAVNTFLDGQDERNPRIRLSIIPYADSVNVGGLANSVVHFETGYTTGEPPSTNDPVAASTAPDNCATERKGRYQYSDAGPDFAKVNRDHRLKFCPNAVMQPLTANIATLEANIDSFAANGYTAGHIGIQWSWYMLSERWAGFLPAASKPAKRNGSKVAKYAILMTDGQFNTAFADVPKNAKTRGAQPNRSRNKAERLCAEMKRDGIEVFTIGFELNNAQARGVMQKCASGDHGSVQHYYEAADGAALEAAFLKIAANIERLTLVK